MQPLQIGITLLLEVSSCSSCQKDEGRKAEVETGVGSFVQLLFVVPLTSKGSAFLTTKGSASRCYHTLLAILYYAHPEHRFPEEGLRSLALER
jgi:hypothetical protein